MARPKIDDELADAIREIHKEVTGEKARSLEEALQTVVAIAAKTDNREDGSPRLLENWYVGKNAEAVYDRIKRHIREDDDTTPNRSDPNDSIVSSNQGQTGNPRSSGEPIDTLVFKGKVSAERAIEIPEIELEAFGIEEGDYLQFYAEPISVESLREQGKQE
jgi:hypothetical protein